MENKDFELLVEAVAVLMGDYSSVRKKAANLIVRALVPWNIATQIFDEAMKACETEKALERLPAFCVVMN